jgi:hypothetical protein
MTKKLILFAPSTLDGPDQTIGPKGLELARLKGLLMGDRVIAFNRLFYGPFLETTQTALAFCEGLNNMPTSNPVRVGLGDKTLFVEISTPEFKLAATNGMSNFNAVKEIHGEAKAMIWAEVSKSSVLSMFDQLKHNEVGVGFFLSPMIELAAWCCGANSVPKGWDRLGDMEGLIFSHHSERKILVEEKISKQRNFQSL